MVLFLKTTMDSINGLRELIGDEAFLKLAKSEVIKEIDGEMISYLEGMVGSDELFLEFIATPCDPKTQIKVIDRQPGLFNTIFEYDSNMSEEVVNFALKRYGLIIHYLDNPTTEQWIIAIKSNPRVVINQSSRELWKIALAQDGLLLKYLDDQDSELCRIACQQNPDAHGYAKVSFGEELDFD